MKTLSLVLLAAIILLCSSHSHAAGLGIYGTFGGGTADWTVDNTSSLDFSKRTNHFGAGLALDTAPARDRLFNYQLNLGYDRFRNSNGKAWGNAEFEGFVISNCFGFGGLINDRTRLWFGPEIRLEWANGHPDNFPSYKIRLFGFGIGPVVGVNFNIGESQTFAVKAGYQFINYAGVGHGMYSHTGNATPTYSNSYDYDVSEQMAYVTLQYFFRTSGDR